MKLLMESTRSMSLLIIAALFLAGALFDYATEF